MSVYNMYVKHENHCASTKMSQTIVVAIKRITGEAELDSEKCKDIPRKTAIY